MKKYLTKADFINKNFYIDSFNLDRIFKENTFTSYRIKVVPVGHIIMPYPGSYIRLEESPVYKYLNKTTESKNNYELYCQKYGKLNKNRTVEKYESLINELSSYDYDINKGIIVVNQANVLLDGQHRSCLLLKLHGTDYNIPVLEVTDKRCTMLRRIIILKDLFLHKKITEI